MKRFPRKRVIITGAGSGLGRAVSIAFAHLGWHVCVSDIDNGRAEQTATLVTQAGGDPLVAQCDVTHPEHLISLTDMLEQQWGGVDIVVNNAGVAAAGFMEKIHLQTWDWIIALNLKSVIYGCRAFIPLLEKQGGGHIVNVASNAGIASLPEMSCYNVTKAGVISLSETLRCELAPRNIGVTVVAPTFFKTNLMDQFISTDQRQREMAEAFFKKANSTAEEVANDLIKAVRKNKLYAVPQLGGSFIWFCKRMAPELYFKVLSWGYKRGLGDKLLGISKRS